MAAAPSEPFLFVVDDDPVYCAMIRRKAESLGFVVACFHPDCDFDRLPRDGDFDVGGIDYDLGARKGTQVSALYFETPVLLVSGSHRPEAEEDAWPQSVRTFMAKDEGTTAVLAAALS